MQLRLQSPNQVQEVEFQRVMFIKDYLVDCLKDFVVNIEEMPLTEAWAWQLALKEVFEELEHRKQILEKEKSIA